MGRGGSRYGAGRPGYRLKTSSCLRLDVRHLAREKSLGRSYVVWSWSSGGAQASTIGIRGQGRESVRLEFWRDGRDCEQTIRLGYTPCPLGGERVWFSCPGCGGRCAVVYLRGTRFACRKCQRLSYPSQSEDVTGRAWRAQQKLERRLGPECARPKGMHAATYGRLLDRICGYEETRDAQLAIFVQRYMPQLGA